MISSRRSGDRVGRVITPWPHTAGGWCPAFVGPSESGPRIEKPYAIRALQACDREPITPAFTGCGDQTLTTADDLIRRGAEDPARRFADLVKLSGLQTRYIDKAQEQRLLEEGVTRFNLSLDEARGILRAVSDDLGYTFETETSRRIQQVLARHAGRRGLVSRSQFDSTAQVLRDFSANTISEAEARRQLKRVMVDNGWRPRRAGLFRSRQWFRSIEA